MSRPLIGLTTYGRDAQHRYSLPCEYSDAVFRAGGEPVLLPPRANHAAERLARLDGIVFTGGGDMDPALYRGKSHPSVYNLDPERDAGEVALAQVTLAADIPVLAICRGMQLLNVLLGGTLHEHLPDVLDGSVHHRLPPRFPTTHPVTVVSDSGLAGVVGQTEIIPVSWHHQGINRLADGLTACAHAPDGLIEAFEFADAQERWFCAVEWHPEMSAASDPAQQRIFQALADAAADYRRVEAGETRSL